MRLTKQSVKPSIQTIWYKGHFYAYFLVPLSWLYCAVVRLRRFLYRQNIFSSQSISVPVVVVGNITVGGTGKTPFILWLALRLQEQGLSVGIISRGYGGQADIFPQNVTAESNPLWVGDEPVLLAQRSGCPVCVAPDRVAAARALLAKHDCDVLLSDDGMQHYHLQRDMEILLIDAQRMFGNGFCLPAGPLREPLKRLKSVDFVVRKGTDMQLSFQAVLSVAENASNEQVRILADFAGKTVHAVAGIANPDVFFSALEARGIKVLRSAFVDHHGFTAADLDFADDYPIIMTEKDAVKCRGFAADNCWFVRVNAELPVDLSAQIITKIISFFPHLEIPHG